MSKLLKEIIFKELKTSIMIMTHQIQNIKELIPNVLMVEKLPNVVEKFNNLEI